ncbi:S8 family serine peptidase [Sinomonas sp. R1AF57]|uniref:S8 family serine peptidase n=1 Tax=Sinomonas sp. R1AF57 TaxID=2020377 RepID=UPI000B6064CD|nr:S8 family serine peptidase [Sinomonas sp. R1AF57]ASN53497.1 KP-43 peptidase [Sinomonas sp. R1AF57]
MTQITINGVSLDPAAEAAAPAAHAREVTDAASSDYILVQTAEPLTEDQRAQLEATGAVVHEYVPDDTYLCGFEPKDLGPVRALPFVTWAGVYLRGFKVNPALRDEPPAVAREIVPREVGPRPSRKPRTVDVVLHDDVDPASAGVLEQIAAAAKLDPSSLEPGRHKVRITVEQGVLDRIAAVDKVRHIEEVPQRQLFNNHSRVILHADVLVNGTEYKGDGEVVAVADTGFDKGSTTDVHPAFTGRVEKLYALGRPNPANADDPHGHGTHVAGSVLGDGTSATMGGAIQGTAPAARLVLQSTLDSAGQLGGLPADLHDLFRPPYDTDGARVHTNSWGSTTPGLPYDSSSQEIDDFVWTHQDMVITFAAGNDGADKDRDGLVDGGSIGSQSAAKNCITVGASEGDRPAFAPTYGQYWPADFPSNPVRSDRQANRTDGMVAFSSRGPTKEQRIKPDVVAPGTCILSTLSRQVASPSTDFGTSTDPLWFFDSGTSMATPLVAGCVAVLRETLVKNGTATPSAALVKALLINGAVELAGQYVPTEAGASPNGSSGWGRVDLAGSVIIPGPSSDGGFGEGGPLKQGEEESFTVDIPGKGDAGASPAAAGSATFKVTLVWSDPPGAALQNDLDLIVRAADGTERHGNMGTSDGFDRRNNVEQVLWQNMPPGKATVVVRAFRITRFPQPYAYAWRIG